MTPDGRIASIGDVEHEFPIESISKVFTLALVIEQQGHSAVRAKIGANPTGAAFDSVLALELHHDKPTSPLVNAGAIATTSLVQATDSVRPVAQGTGHSECIRGAPAVPRCGDQCFRAGHQRAQ